MNNILCIEEVSSISPMDVRVACDSRLGLRAGDAHPIKGPFLVGIGVGPGAGVSTDLSPISAVSVQIVT